MSYSPGFPPNSLAAFSQTPLHISSITVVFGGSATKPPLFSARNVICPRALNYGHIYFLKLL